MNYQFEYSLYAICQVILRLSAIVVILYSFFKLITIKGDTGKEVSYMRRKYGIWITISIAAFMVKGVMAGLMLGLILASLALSSFRRTLDSKEEIMRNNQRKKNEARKRLQKRYGSSYKSKGGK